MQVKLQVGVAAVFTTLTVVLLGVVVAFLYFGNRNLALTTAQEEMSKAREWSVETMIATVRRTERAVSSAASFFGKFPEQAKSLNGLDTLHALVKDDDHFYGVYFGVEDTGAFYQNVLLTDDITAFGPDDTPVPDTASRVLRIIDGGDDTMTETYFWSSEQNMARMFLTRTPSYDPRERPWYIGALEGDGLYATEPYVFESTGQLGVTFAERVLDPMGEVIGVVGIDMTMSSVSRILEDLRIGDDGVVFMLDETGRLASYAGSRSSGQGARFLTSDPDEAVEITDAVIDAAISEWMQNQAAFFRFDPTRDGNTHVASVSQISEIFGTQYTLGLAVPEEEFIGAINRTTTRALQISGLVLIIAISATVIVARLLSTSLSRVAGQARRISTFDLGVDLNLRSVLYEVRELERAMSSMKAGLASFGAYVPKDLVRSIVSEGEMTGVGGTSRDVTLLFSDLQGFTARTEALAPEDLMPALSRYFEGMETEIAATGGSVDKYMGDAIMAMWNAPVEDPRHVEHACRAALACRRAEQALNADPALAPLAPMTTRFGVHTGRVIVGNVGSLSRMQYTALGSVVNLASRIEGLNKAYGTHILVSDAVADQVSDLFLLREVDLVSPAGTSKPTRLYELLGELDTDAPFAASAAEAQDVRTWMACYHLYQARDWAKALDALKDFKDQTKNTVLVDTYIERCRTFLDQPPSEDWDGVVSFSTK